MRKREFDVDIDCVLRRGEIVVLERSDGGEVEMMRQMPSWPDKE